MLDVNRGIAWIRRNPFTLAFVVAGFGVLAVYLVLQAQVNDLAPKVVGGSQTCSGGNDAACVRVCEKLRIHQIIVDNEGQRFSIRCDTRPAAKINAARGVVASSGNPPSSQPGPATGGAKGGGLGSDTTPTTSTPSPSTSPSPKPTANVATPDLPVVHQPQVCVGSLLAVNC